MDPDAEGTKRGEKADGGLRQDVSSRPSGAGVHGDTQQIAAVHSPNASAAIYRTSPNWKLPTWHLMILTPDQPHLASHCLTACHAQERKQAWGSKQFQQYIGMDVTSLLSVPVWIMEPFTILQKAAEIMEYTDLLDKANACNDEYERCVPAVWEVWMAGFTNAHVA